MKRILDTLKILAALIPAVKALIREVEELMPEGGRGAEKLELVRELLSDVFDVIGEVPVAFAALWPIIERLIGRFVDIFNATGEFQKQ